MRHAAVQPPRTRQATGHLPPSSRKRKSLADSPEDDDAFNSGEEDLGSDVDPDFKALSKNQRRRIDEVFEVVAGAGSGDGRSNKRRKVDAENGGGGGFMMDDDMGGGGFMAEDTGGGGGGFMADDDDMMGGGFGGGFMAEQSSEPVAEPTSHLYENTIPLSSLPDLFTQLDLPFDDDVLATFKGMYIPPPAGGDPGPGPDYTTKRDFRAVCAALMEPEVDEEEVREVKGRSRLRRESDSDDDDEDVYIASQGEGEDDNMDVEPAENDNDATPESPLSGLSSDELPTKPKSRTKSTKSQSQSNQDLRLDAAQRATKLSKEQKSWVVNMWNTMFEGTENAPSVIMQQRGPKVLGKEQVRRWAGVMEQNWSDAEVRCFFASL